MVAAIDMVALPGLATSGPVAAANGMPGLRWCGLTASGLVAQSIVSSWDDLTTSGPVVAAISLGCGMV